jgi:hypothetical protein
MEATGRDSQSTLSTVRGSSRARRATAASSDAALEVVPGITPAKFCEPMIDAHLEDECKGRMRDIKPEYQGR